MTYPHTVRFTRASSTAAGEDEDSGWGETATLTDELYNGRADVQDGTRTVRMLTTTAGEASDANALVFFPPRAASEFAGLRIGDLVETPIGSGTVTSLFQMDAAAGVRIDDEIGQAPVVIN